MQELLKSQQFKIGFGSLNESFDQQFCFGVRDHMFEQLFFKMILLRLKKVSFVDLGLGSRVMTPNSSTNRIF